MSYILQTVCGMIEENCTTFNSKVGNGQTVLVSRQSKAEEKVHNWQNPESNTHGTVKSVKERHSSNFTVNNL